MGEIFFTEKHEVLRRGVQLGPEVLDLVAKRVTRNVRDFREVPSLAVENWAE